MNSIDRNQPEHNRADLSPEESVAKMREIVDQAKTCFFCTAIATSETDGIRPMAVQEVDDEGNFWFLSASDSHKDLEVEASPSVKLLFQGSAHSGFMQVDGEASISADRARIREFWKPVMNTWFTGGIDDPRIRVIKVVPTGGYYWDNRHGGLVASVKMLIGAALHRTLDDSVQGRLTPGGARH